MKARAKEKVIEFDFSTEPSSVDVEEFPELYKFVIESFQEEYNSYMFLSELNDLDDSELLESAHGLYFQFLKQVGCLFEQECIV